MGRYRKDSPSRRPLKKAGQPHDEDTALWEKVTESVTELPSRQDMAALFAENSDEAAGSPRPEPAFGPVTAKAAKTPVKSAAPKPTPFTKTETIPADLRLGQHSGIDRTNARRLQRGQMEIEDRLDLHGLSQDQAHQRLVAFISRAVQQNLRHVLVITGKGRAGQGVLRTKVPEWLKDAPLASHINAIAHAQPGDGGTGALYIRLKRQRGEIR